MPLVHSNYRSPFFLRNGHLSTMYAGIFRSIHGVVQKRERLELLDGDFLDLDWSKSLRPTKKLVLLLHGLEGNAQRHYIKGSVKGLIQNGHDTCAINFRGCSGHANRLYRSYHSGATEDLISVIDHILENKDYTEIFLLGYSLGGNLILKYLGEGNAVPKELKAAVAVSVPCDLKDVSDQLQRSKNVLYSTRFKKSLLAKLRMKQRAFPERISEDVINGIVTLKDFDDAYTSPAHGFKDALDYYAQCSCKQFLPNIKLPSLILNAKDDPFLGGACYPYTEAELNDHLYLETPTFGGHVGFIGNKNVSYAEVRALGFFKSLYL